MFEDGFLNFKSMSKKKKILIAEDDKPIGNAMKLKLEKFGFDVALAQNGQVALEFLDKDSFDLILTDLMMPIVNGFELLQEIKKREIQTSVFVTTNLGQPEDEVKVKNLGAEKYFVKSDTSILQLVNRIKEYLDKK